MCVHHHRGRHHREDRTQENTDTGATTDRRATARPSRSCYRHRCEYLPTIGDRSHPRSCCSCMLQSLSGNDTDTPKEYRRTGGTGIAHTGYYRQTRSCMCVHHHRGDIIGRTGTQEGDRLTGSLSRPCMLQSLSGCHLTLFFGEK